MRNRARFLSLVVGGLTTGCGYSAPYQASEPAVANQGVQIALAGERCYVNRSTEQFPTTVNDDQLRLDVKLNVVNQSNRAAVLRLDALQLQDTAAGTRAAIRPMESGALELAPGESKVVPLAFEEEPAPGQPERLDCRHDLALETANAVAVDGKPISLAAIHFQPAR